MRCVLILATSLTCLSCYSPGKYGYSRSYAPLSDEEDATKGVREYDPVMAQRKPEAWKGKPLTLFGTVVSRHAGGGGAADLKLSVRTLAKRNLCDTADEESCRVTVSEREHAIVHARVKLEDEDDVGKLSVGVGSLLRVVGVIVDDVGTADGAPVVRVSYYRHWPRNFYVTTKDRSHMRR